MRIDCADVSFNVQRDFQRTQQLSAARRVPHAKPTTEAEKSARERPAPAIPSTSELKSPDHSTGKNENSHHFHRFPEQHPLLSRASELDVEQWLEQGVDANLLAIKRILEHYLGHEIAVGVIVAGGCDGEAKANSEQDALTAVEQVAEAPEQWVHLSLREAERTEVAIAAEIHLRSGTSIQVAIDQRMARSLVIEKDMTAQAAAAYLDPLVINFGGPVQLSDERIDFDLNADGVDEQIARFASVSGFIAWDKNGDGVINDGSELFGALTGDGFAELAVYDQDKNDFIDDGDAIFSQLLVYRPGDSKLTSLASHNVAALYLGNAVTPFQLDSHDGDVAGRVRTTGFYIGGSEQQGYHAGTLQQIDLVV